MIHHLKSWPEFFQPVFDDRKPFELRYNDRDYQVGDVLVIHEWSPETGYTKRSVKKLVMYILKGPFFNPTHTSVEPGLAEGWVIMALGGVETK